MYISSAFGLVAVLAACGAAASPSFGPGPVKLSHTPTMTTKHTRPSKTTAHPTTLATSTTTTAVPSCASIFTTTWLHGEACPAICVPSSLCPTSSTTCGPPATSCAPGSTLITSLLDARITETTSTVDCTATINVFEPCILCGCETLCTTCVPKPT